jgi:hypothetical protein
MSVEINTLAPTSSKNEAAICVTAKICWRRFVPPVMRAVPLEKPSPLEERRQPWDKRQDHGRDDGQCCSYPQQAGIYF